MYGITAHVPLRPDIAENVALSAVERAAQAGGSLQAIDTCFRTLTEESRTVLAYERFTTLVDELLVAARAQRRQGPTPRERLDRRLADDEITLDEHTRMLAVLDGKPARKRAAKTPATEKAAA